MGIAWIARGCLAAALAAVVVLVTTAAAAQPLPISRPEAGSGGATTHVVTLRGGTPGVIWEIYGSEGFPYDQRPLARCGERGCKLQMRTGQYRLVAARVDGSGPHGYRELLVNSDLDLTAYAPSRAAKSAGLVLAIAGKIAFVTGLTLTTLGAAGVCDCPVEDPVCECDPDPGMLSAGLFTMLGGAVAIPAGWILFARNRHPHIEHNLPASVPGPSPSGAGAPADSTPALSGRAQDATGWFRLGPVRIGSGWGIGSQVAF